MADPAAPASVKPKFTHVCETGDMFSLSFVLIVSSIAIVAATLIAGIVIARGEDQIRDVGEHAKPDMPDDRR